MSAIVTVTVTEVAAGPTPVAPVNVNATLETDKTYLLVTRLHNPGSAGGGDFKYQFSHAGGSWTDLTPTSDFVHAVGANSFEDGDDVPPIIGGEEPYITNNRAATEDGSFTLPGEFPPGSAVESALAFELRSANLRGGQTGQIRIVQGDGTPLAYHNMLAYTVAQEPLVSGLFTILLADEEVVQSSAEVTATAIDAPGTAGDFIGLYHVFEMNSSAWLSRQLVSIGEGTKQWPATMPSVAGDYHFRYVTAGGDCLARSQTVAVVVGTIHTVGGSASDFSSPAAAASRMNSGDVALIRDGTYGGFNANINGLTFRAERRHGAIIAGSDQVVGGSGTGAALKGLVVRGGGATGTSSQYNGCVNIRSNWVLEDVIVERSDNYREGVRSASSNAANRYRLERCILQDNRGNGIWGRPNTTNPSDHNGAIIKDTIFRRNNRAGLSPGFYNGGCKLMYTNNLMIDGLISYDNFGVCCWLDFGSTNYRVQNCTLFGSHGTTSDAWASGGLYTEANPGPGVVQGNAIYSCIDYGIILAESQNILVQNNLIVDTRNAWGLRTVSGRPAPNNIDLIGNITDGNTPTSPGTDVVESGTVAPGSFAGPVQSVREGSSFTPQVTQLPESETIDAAIAAAGAGVGELVTIPCYGRKAIVADGSQWVTEVYDLMCRYVRLTIPTLALRDTLAAGIPQYANTQGREIIVRLSVKSANGYDVEARLEGVI